MLVNTSSFRFVSFLAQQLLLLFSWFFLLVEWVAWLDGWMVGWLGAAAGQLRDC